MDKDRLKKLPIISLSKTSGLTSSDQIISGSENDLFSFQDSTSKPENKLMLFFPSFTKVSNPY